MSVNVKIGEMSYEIPIEDSRLSWEHVQQLSPNAVAIGIELGDGRRRPCFRIDGFVEVTEGMT